MFFPPLIKFLFELVAGKKNKKGQGTCPNPLIFMVGGTGFEPVTSTV